MVKPPNKETVLLSHFHSNKKALKIKFVNPDMSLFFLKYIYFYKHINNLTVKKFSIYTTDLTEVVIHNLEIPSSLSSFSQITQNPPSKSNVSLELKIHTQKKTITKDKSTMDDNSAKSPLSFESGSVDSNTNNQPPEQPTQGGASSTNKRKIDEDDNAVYSTANKRHRTDPSSVKDQELTLLKDMIDYYNKNSNQSVFFDDENLEMFYNGWVKERCVYKNVVELSNKMYKLHARFMKNKENPLYKHDVAGEIDHVDIQIFRLSYAIWATKEDKKDNVVYSPAKKPHQTDPSSSKDQRIALLEDMFDYCLETKNRFAFCDDNHLESFYNGWIKGRGVYKNVVELSNQMYKLHVRFLKNKVIPLYKYDQEGIDPVEREIYRLSYAVWSTEEDDLTSYEPVSDSERKDSTTGDSNYQSATETDFSYTWPSNDSTVEKPDELQDASSDDGLG